MDGPLLVVIEVLYLINVSFTVHSVVFIYNERILDFLFCLNFAKI